MQTAYGFIPDEELVTERIPNNFGVKLINYITKMYDPFFDKRSAPILIKLNGEKIIRLNSKCKTKIS